MVCNEQIQTAVLLGDEDCPCDQDSLEEPLLQAVSLDYDETEATKEGDFVNRRAKTLNRQFRMIGAFAGFLIQSLSLSATTIIAARYGGAFVNGSGDQQEYLLHEFLLVLEKCTYLQYLLVFFPIMGSLSPQGVEYAQTRWFQREVHDISESTARMMFVMAVNFLSGLLIGSFAVWCIADLLLGSFSLLIPTFGALVVCLSICYGIVKFYDCLQEDKEETTEYL